jgi:anti-anti-sigma regulatory factor
LRLAGQVTFIDGPKLLDMSSGIPARTHHVTIDVTDLTAIDTAGLQALERLTASVRKQGASVTWKGAQGEVAQRLAHFGLTVAEPGHGKAG